MARKSFLIKKYESDSASSSAGSASVFGSYLQYPVGSSAASVGLTVRPDEDTQLKADDLATVPVLNEPVIPGSLRPSIAYFESQVLDYNEIKLSWNLSLATTLTTTPQATRVLIVYSQLGEPQTVAEGLLLIDTNSATEFTHYVEPGKWAYYSMFLRYETSTGVVYYDKAATIADLPPNNYGCSEDMYGKIPEHYRVLDGGLDQGNGGPLKRMISLFGFEADRMRTLIDFVISCKDPMIANSEILDVIAKDLTVDIRADELGASKLRNLLDGVGSIRRSLGTPGSIAVIVQSATGSEAAFNLTGMQPAIDIYAQRINYLKDPNIIGGAAGSFAGGLPGTTVFTSTFEAGNASGGSVSATYQGGTPYSSASPYDPFVDQDKLFQDELNLQFWQYSPDPTAGGSLSYLKTIDNKIPVIGGDTFYFSMHGDFIENAQNEVVRVAFYGLGSGAASAGYSGTNDDVLICQTTSAITIAGIKYWKLEVPASVTTWRSVSFTLFINTSANISRGFQKMLLERVLGGSYFDGDTAEGGWVIDYATGNKVSDYRWYDVSAPTGDAGGTPQQSYSIYNSNYKKTKSLAARYLPQVLPVTQISASSVVYSNAMQSISTPIWALNWNVIPGISNV